MRCVPSIVVAVVACSSPPPRAPAPRAPSPGIDEVLAAFERAPVVGFGERHRSVTTHAFLRELIRDPRFAATVNDIVVEFSTPLHQATLDRFVIAGETVDEQELRRVWQDTTQLLVWDAPMYRQLLETVRDVNRALPRERRIRVLGGDPPIDWSKVHSRADYAPFAARDPDTARVIEREVLARHRKALVVIGAMHLPRREPLAIVLKSDGATLTQLLQQHDPHSIVTVFTITSERPVVAGWRPREFRFVTGALAARSFSELMEGSVRIMTKGPDGKPVPREIKPEELPTIGEMVDAILYLGPDTGEVDAPAELYRDRAYVERLRQRSAVMKEIFGMDFGPDIDAEVKRAGGS